PSDLVEFAVLVGRAYLSAGGPTSRIEAPLVETGRAFGYRLQIFATPTGVCVSVHKNGSFEPLTLLGRIENISSDLSELTRIERVLERLIRKELDLTQAHDEVSMPPASSFASLYE